MVNSGPVRDSNLVSAESGTIVAGSVPHIELADVLELVAVLAFRLDIHLPLAAEAVEVVDERAAHERLNRSVDIVDVDTLLEHLVAIDRR